MRTNTCPHINSEHVELLDAKRLEKAVPCSTCAFTGPNLWFCLHRNCSFVGCSEQVKDHSTDHFKNKFHCVHINMTSRRAWCYFCEREVGVGLPVSTQNSDVFSSLVGMFASKDFDSEDESSSIGMGLVGLQNIANTCYMNSALQALSNLIPMTHYFLNCSEIIDHIIEESIPRTKAAGLAKSYQRLMREIWENSEKKFYVAPRGILYGIRSVHPMFRGFQQHDTQEFLRCFMDQLHEELKELNYSKDLQIKNNTEGNDNSSYSECSSYTCTPNISDSEYETCDSSLSSNSVDIQPTKLVKLEKKKIKIKNDNPSQSQQSVKYSSIISEVFDGKLLSSVQCLTCDRVSTREETFQDLSLPIPNRDYLNVLHQSHSPSMSSLNSIDIATQRSNEGWLNWMWSILRSWLWGPSVTLYDCMASFFSADELKGDNMYSCEKCNKLRTGIKYSRILDLPEVLCIHLKRFRHDLSYSSKISSHVVFPLEGLDMRPYLGKECKSLVSLYSLSSIICHHGTVGGGHYTCYARNSVSNRWYEYDDQHVSEVAADVVENCQAYVLFYQKQNPQIENLRAKATELSILNPVHEDDIRFFLSKEWLSRFSTFAEPGPINNSGILCSHGGVLYSKSTLIGQVAIPISQPVWDFMYRKFGGGPAINMIYECETCKKAAEALARRQNKELAVFTKYNGHEADLDNGAIYAISMPWLRKWQQFARGSTSKEPGPITNNNIAASDILQSFLPMRNVRVGSDYAQINGPFWRFLRSIYGGGPEIILRDSLTEEIEIIDEDELGRNDEICHHNISDTESNIGQKHSVNEPLPEQNDQSIIDQVLINEFLQPLQPMVKDQKSRNFAIKIQRSNALHHNFRKKYKRGRINIKNSDFFGSKGIYKPNRQTTTVELNTDNHSKNTFNEPESFKIENNKPFRRSKKHHKRFLNINEVQRRTIYNRNEQVALQKYSFLQEPDDYKETDA